MDNLNHLHTFYTVAQAGSLTAAAKRLHITQSAVSHSLKALEEQIGTQLIDRARRRFKITEQGQVLLTACEKIFTTYEIALDEIEQRKTGLRGELRLGCHVTLSEEWLVHELPALKEQFPNLDIQLELNAHPHDLIDDLQNMRSDMAILFAVDYHHLPSGLEKALMSKTTVSLVASPEYLEEHGHPETPKDLAQHIFLEFHRDYMIYQRTLTRLLGWKNLVQFSSFLFMDSSRAIRQAARDGMAIAYLGTFFVAKDIERGTLVPLLPERLTKPIKFHCVYRQAQAELPKQKIIREYLTESLQRFIKERTPDLSCSALP